MADLGEAFNSMKQLKKPFQTIDYFFTQRTLTEDREFLDKTMTRQIKKVKLTHNFLALNIPTMVIDNMVEKEYSEKPVSFDIEIYGDDGYSYKGTITSHQGVIPNFMIPIKGDKRLFVNIDYQYSNNSNENHLKKYINFIDVPKRFQNIEENDIETETDAISETSLDKTITKKKPVKKL